MQTVCALQATDFVVRSQTAQCELVRLTCGGHRRPFSFCLDPPSFAYLKDGKLHVCPPKPTQSRPQCSSQSAGERAPDGPLSGTANLHRQTGDSSPARSSSLDTGLAAVNDCTHQVEKTDDSSQSGSSSLKGDPTSEQSWQYAEECGDQLRVSRRHKGMPGEQQRQHGNDHARPAGASVQGVSSDARLLHVPHHGRELLCALLIPGPPQQQQTSPEPGDACDLSRHRTFVMICSFSWGPVLTYLLDRTC